ncbi:MAG TPA: hypothetical protein VEK11_16495 [Thermoanaerobaculia bacterium]|nr:hypothetical protein [Thermoanaerobaculia bacterium]
MTAATRLILLLMLLMPFFHELAAQETTPETTTAAEATTTAEPGESDATTTATTTSTASEARARSRRTSYEIRTELGQILRNEVPPEVAMVLKLDPSLLSNETWLAGYPALAEFLDAAPEVRRNPRFFLAEFDTPGFIPPRSGASQFIEALAVMSGFGLALFAFTWVVRTIIEQKRWNRMTRTQTEVHNKILDRFGSSEELLQYVKSPAGTKFLESAPIPVHTEHAPAPQNVPMARVMRSVQWGIVTVAAGLGLFLVSLRFRADGGTELFALGVIAFFVGGGFIASALVSLVMSRRLGLWQNEQQSPTDSGFVK